jgi:hypothetical protein
MSACGGMNDRDRVVRSMVAAAGIGRIGCTALATLVVCATGVIGPAVATAAPAATGWVRFGHFVPSAGPVDVSVDGTSLGTDLTFRDVTNYVSMPAGTHTLSLVAAATPDAAPIATSTITVVAGGAETVAAVAGASPTSATTAADPTGGPVAIQTYTDDLATPPPGDAEARLILTVPGVAQVTGQLEPAAGTGSSTLTVGPVAYGQGSPYASVAAGTYNVSIDSGTTPLLNGVNWPVAAGTVTSIVVVDTSTGPNLEVLDDAVGASSQPVGGMQTGLGGTAKPGGNRLEVSLAAASAGAVAVLGAGWLTRIRRRRRGAESSAPA